ncbi:MAG: hypothetical protein BWY28_02964 [bacterium ADurb.Bin236]|nr:MAG: hypothetical protein BWY28_02964 [bacterium ADurb.Bin236]
MTDARRFEPPPHLSIVQTRSGMSKPVESNRVTDVRYSGLLLPASVLDVAAFATASRPNKSVMLNSLSIRVNFTSRSAGLAPERSSEYDTDTIEGGWEVNHEEPLSGAVIWMAGGTVSMVRGT